MKRYITNLKNMISDEGNVDKKFEYIYILNTIKLHLM